MSDLVLTFTVVVVASMAVAVLWITYRVDDLIKDATDAIAYLTITIDRLMLEEPCADCEDETTDPPEPPNVVSLMPFGDGAHGGGTTGSP